MTSLVAMLARLASMASLVACAATDVDDGRDDSFLSDGKSDAFGITSASYEAAAILEVASTASVDQLKAIGVGTRAANNTVAAARPFPTLAALDAVSYTGEVYFTRLLDHVVDHGLVGSCGDNKLQPTTGERCDGGPGCSATCQPAEDFDTSMIAARIVLPETVGWPYALVTLPSNDYLFVGTSTASTATPLQLGGKLLTRSGMFAAVIDNAGNVVTLRSVTAGGQPLPDGPIVVKTWGDRIQLQHRQDVYELDLASATVQKIGAVPPSYKLMRTLDTGDVLASINGGVVLLDVTSLEVVWSFDCAHSWQPELSSSLTDRALWCGKGTSLPDVRRYSVEGDLATRPLAGQPIPRTARAIAGVADGVWIIDGGRLERFGDAGYPPLSSAQFNPGGLPDNQPVTQKGVAIDAAGGQAIVINEAGYPGDRLGRADNTNYRQVVFSSSSTVNLRLGYFTASPGLPWIRSTPSSIAVIDIPRFRASQAASEPRRTILIVPRAD